LPYQPARSAYLRIAVDLNLFTHLYAAGPSGATASSLASKCSADPALVSRILKHLAAMNIVAETDVDTYAPTPLSNAFMQDRYRDGLIYTYDVAGPSFRHLPEYLKGTGHRLPTSLTDGPFQAAHRTSLPFFEWLDKHPEYGRAFNSYMSAYRAGKPSWVDDGFYPIADRLVKGFDPSVSDVFLVDVGGGLGHDLRELTSKVGSLPGRLVLQDREEVISTIPKSDCRHFEATAHDFFTPQPVRGARGYYLHSVLHDWGDEDCVRILEQLKPAIRKGYSRVLINEIVVPDKGASWPVTAMDSLVFVLGVMRERTEKDWEAILTRAGYRVVRVYASGMGSESLIEAGLV
jgi:hypothetical protein